MFYTVKLYVYIAPLEVKLGNMPTHKSIFCVFYFFKKIFLYHNQHNNLNAFVVEMYNKSSCQLNNIFF